MMQLAILNFHSPYSQPEALANGQLNRLFPLCLIRTMVLVKQERKSALQYTSAGM